MAEEKLFEGQESHLLEFYGTECHFCIQMKPIVERVEKEEGVTFQKLEVWHDAKNAQILQKADDGKCGGVPFFLNTKTGEFICGATDYEKFKAFALGE